MWYFCCLNICMSCFKKQFKKSNVYYEIILILIICGVKYKLIGSYINYLLKLLLE